MKYWAHIRGTGFHAYRMAGTQALSAALRTTNPGPWISAPGRGVGAVVDDGRVEAILAIGEQPDAAARDRLSPFMKPDRLGMDERTALLAGGNSAERGGEICACLGVSCGAVEAGIARGAATIDAVGAVTGAGTNCGSCRPEIRSLLRASRLATAA